MTVSALDLTHCFLCGSISDVCEVCSDLLVDGNQALAILSTESGLLLLVDDLVESLVQEDGQPIPLIIRRGYIAWMVFGDLGDVIGDVSHTWMIGRGDGVMREKTRHARSLRPVAFVTTLGIMRVVSGKHEATPLSMKG